jgi:hypothetical protein
MFKVCRWLHKKLESLPLIKFPFDISKLPDNGSIICFFYEGGVNSTHGNDDNNNCDNNDIANNSTSISKVKPRMVRLGTSSSRDITLDENFSKLLKV